MIQADFDGACEPKNPGGHGAFGVVIRDDGEVVYRNSGYCGHGRTMSCNVAEYCGVIAALTKALTYEGVITLRGDSKLVIMQLGPDRRFGSKPWEAKRGLYLRYYKEAIALVNQHRARLLFEWIPRDENEECDVLSKQALINRGVHIVDRKKGPTHRGRHGSRRKRRPINKR